MFVRFRHLIVSIVLLASLLPIGAVMAATPVVPATLGQTLDAGHLKTLKEIYGTPITIGEYFTALYPSRLDGIMKALPQEQRRLFFETPMPWPPKPVDPPSEDHAIANPASSDTVSIDSIDSLYTVSMSVPAPTSPVSGYVFFGSGLYTFPTTYLPEMNIMSYLWYYTGSGWDLKDTVYNSGYWVSQLTAQKAFSTSDDGYYRNEGTCFYQNLPDVLPVWRGWSDMSGQVYLTP